VSICANNFREDVLGLGSPDEGFGTFVVQGYELLDGSSEFWDASKHAVAQTFDGDVAEETLDHVEPGGRGWSEMNMESWVLGTNGLPLLTTGSASPFALTRLLVGSLALLPALLLFGNSRQWIAPPLLPHATGAYGQLPGRDFNPLDPLLLLNAER